jgi:dihydroxy-acid dehydratase
MLLEEGLLNGECMTITGRTLRQNVQDLPGLKKGQNIIQPRSTPLKDTGHIQILRGNLAPDGAVAKITGKEGLRFSGPARVLRIPGQGEKDSGVNAKTIPGRWRTGFRADREQ